MNIVYPVRARIVDVSNAAFTLYGWKMKTPDASLPHMGKRGTAYQTLDGVRIELDDGSILYGYECWWVPLT